MKYKLRYLLIIFVLTGILCGISINTVSASASQTSLSEDGIYDKKVSEGESIQQALDQAENGDIIYVSGGTYNENLEITKNHIILETNEDVTIVGEVEISGESVTVDGFSIVEGFTGVSADSDNINLKNIYISDTTTHGMELSGENIQIQNIEVEDPEGSAVRISSTRDGTVDVDELTVLGATGTWNNPAHDWVNGRALRIHGGEDININNVESIGADGDGIAIFSGDARGQNIDIEDVYIAEAGGYSDSDGVGVYVAGSNGEDTLTMSDILIEDAYGHGVEIRSANNVDIQTLDIDDPNDSGLRIVGERDSTISVSDTNVINPTATWATDIDRYTDGRGLWISGGDSIDLSSIYVEDADSQGIRVTDGDSRDQDLQIHDSEILKTEDSGVYMTGSGGTDSVLINDTTVTDAGGYGFSFPSVENVVLNRVDSVNDGSGELNLEVIDREEAQITDSFGQMSTSNGETESDNGDGSIIPVSFGQIVTLLILGGGVRYVYRSFSSTDNSSNISTSANSNNSSSPQQSSSSGTATGGYTPGDNPGKPSISDNQSGAAYSGSTQIVDPVDPDSSSNSDNSDTGGLVDPSQPESSSSNTIVDLVDPDDDDVANGADQKDGNQ